MDGLEGFFGGQIDFIHLDTEDAAQRRAGQAIGLFRRNQYLLLDSEGKVLYEWNGYLRNTAVRQIIELELAKTWFPKQQQG